MEDKRKAHPEARESHQMNRTIPKARNQWLAEILIDMIGGSDCPIKRPINASVDREMRGLIQERNTAGEDVIINIGDGYFRPGPDDREVFLEYCLKERCRAKEILKKIDTMMETYTAQYGKAE